MQFTEIVNIFRETAEAALVLQGYQFQASEKPTLRLPFSLFQKLDELLSEVSPSSADPSVQRHPGEIHQLLAAA